MKTIQDKTERKCPDGVKRTVNFSWDKVETLEELKRVATEADLKSVNLYRSTRAAEKVARELVDSEVVKKQREMATALIAKFPGKTVAEIEELLGL